MKQRDGSSEIPQEQSKINYMYPDFQFVEVAFGGVHNRNNVVEYDNVKAYALKWKRENGQKLFVDCFRTYFRYPVQICEHYSRTNSVKGYSGSCYADFLPFDIDSEDINKAHEMTKQLLLYLQEKYDLDLKSVGIYFSGAKGFHVELPSILFGFEPSTDLPKILKHISVSIIPKDIKIDTAIYNKTRLWRLTNTVNSKTGYYKIPLSDDEILNLTIEQILKLSEKQRRTKFHINSSEINPKLNKIYKKSMQDIYEIKPSEEKTTMKEYELLLSNGAQTGERNNAITSLAGILKSKGIAKDEALTIMNSVNETRCEPPLEDEEILTIANSIYSYPDDQTNKSQADLIVEIVEKLSIELFHDEHGEPYARIRVKNHFEIVKIRSRQFKRFISQELWKLRRKVPHTDALNASLNIIEAKACFEGEQHVLYNRVAWHDDSIWYDLGNWKAVKINMEGWSIIDEPPIIFRKYGHQKIQVEPLESSASNIHKIFDFVNIKDEDHKLLFIANLICALIPDIPHPIDVFHGDQGVAKTTTSRVKKELVDPSALQTLTYPQSKAEFVQIASHHWFFFLDNMADLPEWLSDALCRVSTGEGFSKRMLYTDDEDIIYNFKRCCCLNGINLVPTKPDLLDRTIIYELEIIPQTVRKSEQSFWKEFQKERPILLGSLFSLLSEAMNHYQDVSFPQIPRMADFAIWGCAITKTLGHDECKFLDAYKQNIKSQNEEAIEASPIATAIIGFFDGQDKWEGSPSELIEEINLFAEQIKLNTKARKWPKDTNWLWRRIKEVRTNLKNVGINVKKIDTDHSKREIILERMLSSESDMLQKNTLNDAAAAMLPERSMDHTQGNRPQDIDNIENNKAAELNSNLKFSDQRHGDSGGNNEEFSKIRTADPWDDEK